MITYEILKEKELVSIKFKRSIIDFLYPFFKFPDILFTLTVGFTFVPLILLLYFSDNSGSVSLEPIDFAVILFFIFSVFAAFSDPSPKRGIYFGNYKIHVNLLNKGVKNEYGEVIRFNDQTGIIQEGAQLFIVTPITNKIERLEILAWYTKYSTLSPFFVKDFSSDLKKIIS